MAEGVELRCGVDVGRDVTRRRSCASAFDAVVLATGSRVPRELPVPGRELDGVHFAMDYLYLRNRWVAERARARADDPRRRRPSADQAAGKDVVVIGGGDTGADCVGNAMREGARSVVQLELLPRAAASSVPTSARRGRCGRQVPPQLRDGGGQRAGASASRTTRSSTTRFSDDGRAGWQRCRSPRPRPSRRSRRSPGTERELPAQLVLLAMGFLHPEPELLDQLGVERDPRGNVKARARPTRPRSRACSPPATPAAGSR